MSTPSLFRLIEPATPAMSYDMTLPFSFPAVRGKKVTAAFDGGRLSSDGGVMLLAAAARRMGIAEKLAAVVAAKAAAAAGRADANSATEKYNAVLLAFCNAALLTDNDGSLGMIVVTGPAGTTGASYSGWKMAAI